MWPFSPARSLALALASRSRLTHLAAPSSRMNRFRLTGASPATVHRRWRVNPGFAGLA